MDTTTPYVAPAQPAENVAGYQYAAYAPPKPSSGKAVAGFVVSLLGVSLVGLILSILGLKDTKDGEKQGRGLAIAGVIIGAIGAIWQLIVVVTLIAGVAAESASGSFA
jgi:CDP-diglyceride synthetase